jgi:hypothetical protein
MGVTLSLIVFLNDFSPAQERIDFAIVDPHVRNALYFFSKSARTLTHFIL